MPSKTLLYVADILHHARNAGKLGLRLPGAAADMAAVQARKRQIISDFASYRAGQLQSGRFMLIRKRVRFVSPSELEAEDGERIGGAHFVVATGSRVNWPGVPGLEPGRVWTSDDVLDLDHLPRSVVGAWRGRCCLRTCADAPATWFGSDACAAKWAAAARMQCRSRSGC
jgi:pyruvate/2-oxoglutarate dehydrogenase complex dihydrolipoamide dehydrogenase (E3) component